jgi:hypothetical protein
VCCFLGQRERRSLTFWENAETFSETEETCQTLTINIVNLRSWDRMNYLPSLVSGWHCFLSHSLQPPLLWGFLCHTPWRPAISKIRKWERNSRYQQQNDIIHTSKGVCTWIGNRLTVNTREWLTVTNQFVRKAQKVSQAIFFVRKEVLCCFI